MAVAANITRAHADVAAARAACSALELISLRVGARQRRLSYASRARGNWVLISIWALAAFASWCGACIATALPSLLAWEGIAMVIVATEIPLGLARISTALASTARKWHPQAIDAHLHSPLVEPLCPIARPLDPKRKK
jgi:hypothetical protein